MSKKMRLGYIVRHDLELNPHLTEQFKYREENYTRKISSRGDKVYSKLLMTPVDYEEVASTTELMKKKNALIITREPFFVDDDLRDRVTKWIEWANNTDPSKYEIW